MASDASSPSDQERQLVELLDHPREDLAVELKDWLDLGTPEGKATLAKELLALANAGGGYVLFGFDDETLEPTGDCPYDPGTYSQDSINGIVARYSEPSFQCGTYRLASTAGNQHVVVSVPGSHRVPIRSKRGGPTGHPLRQFTYYTRRPGPSSEAVSTAREWDDILQRCLRAQRDTLLASFREIAYTLRGDSGTELLATLLAPAESASPAPDAALMEWERTGRQRLGELVRQELPDEEPSRYSRGTWTVSYAVEGVTARPGLAEFMVLLEQVAGHETGWPPWWVPNRDDLRPYPHDGLVECWMQATHFRDPAHSDFWRGDPAGRMFLLRGYQEDAMEQVAAGSSVDLTLPTWRVGECLLHAERLAGRMAGEDARIRVVVRWDGLANRTLAAVAARERYFSPGLRCRQDVVETTATVSPSRIRETLPEVVRTLVAPLYASFDFFEPPVEFYAQELDKMRRGI